MACQALLDSVPLCRDAVYRISGELPARRAAALYAEEIRRATGEDPPCFDLVLLGLGSDGHTASLFPGAGELGKTRQLVVPALAPVEPRQRVTLTLRVINAARQVVLLVSGKAKAEAFARVMQQRRARKEADLPANKPASARPAASAPQPPVAPDLPAALVQPVAGELVWLVDQAAASLYQPRA
jgi:6-phosphogluconolactonase